MPDQARFCFVHAWAAVPKHGAQTAHALVRNAAWRDPSKMVHAGVKVECDSVGGNPPAEMHPHGTNLFWAAPSPCPSPWVAVQPPRINSKVPRGVDHGLLQPPDEAPDALPSFLEAAYWINHNLPWPVVRDLPPAIRLVYFDSILGKKFVWRMYVHSGGTAAQRIDWIVFEDEYLVWPPFDLDMLRQCLLHAKARAVQHHAKAAELSWALLGKADFHLCNFIPVEPLAKPTAKQWACWSFCNI
jgi:hypothetical protein